MEQKDVRTVSWLVWRAHAHTEERNKIKEVFFVVFWWKYVFFGVEQENYNYTQSSGHNVCFKGTQNITSNSYASMEGNVNNSTKNGKKKVEKGKWKDLKKIINDIEKGKYNKTNLGKRKTHRTLWKVMYFTKKNTHTHILIKETCTFSRKYRETERRIGREKLFFFA